MYKQWDFPHSQAAAPLDIPEDLPQDSPGDQHHAISQPISVGKRAKEPARPKRKATLERPDYHALHNIISTPTSKWLALIRDPGKTGRKIREGECILLTMIAPLQASRSDIIASLSLPIQHITHESTVPFCANLGSMTISNRMSSPRYLPRSSSAPIENRSSYRSLEEALSRLEGKCHHTRHLVLTMWSNWWGGIT